MAGWVKLWRKMIENGHLKMPGAAFKLWIYCLLDASPYPDQERGLSSGELWLSYESIRRAISEEGVKIGKSTVSGALKYLSQNGYIELQAIKFKGIKARVINWAAYQGAADKSVESCYRTRQVPSQDPPSPEPGPGKNPENMRPEPSPGPEPGPVPSPQPGLDRPVESSPRTRRVLSQDPTSPPTGPVRASEPYSGAASSAPKNIKNYIKNNDLYTAAVIAGDFEREFGRPISPIEINQLAIWQKTFSHELIREALARAALQDKRTIAYVGGILKNWRRAGITTVEEARREQARPGAKGGKRNARDKPGYRPGEVDWANEPDTL